jgi:hypothetical protein
MFSNMRIGARLALGFGLVEAGRAGERREGDGEWKEF